MAKRFKVWLDSGANHDSCRKIEVSLDDLGIIDEEWEIMSEDEQEKEMREIAFERSDWGFCEIETPNV